MSELLDALRAEVARQEIAESKAKEAYEIAKDSRAGAVRLYNRAAAAEAGIKIGRTVVKTKRRDWRPQLVPCVVTEVSSRYCDMVVVRQLTSAGSVWSRRRPFSARFADLKITDREYQS